MPNINDKGATLEVASPIGIPPEITLYVATSQLRRHGYIVWRKEERIGVVFAISPPGSSRQDSTSDM